MRAVLGLDIGTTTVKAVVLGEDGNRVSEGASSPIPVLSPEPGRAEQNPEAVWEAVVKAATKANVGAHELIGLGVAGQSGSVVAIGEGARTLGPLITWMDRRAEAIVEEWQQSNEAATIRSISGWSVAAGLGLPLIVWMGRHDPATFVNALRFAGPVDWITHRFTGDWVTNPSNASGLQLMELSSAQWSSELCRLAGIDQDRLSTIKPSGSVIGELTGVAAEALGLPQGLPVINGGHDQTCAAFGIGVVDPGQIMLGCGTAWVVTGITERASAPPHLSINRHVVAGRFTVSKALGNLGEEPERARASVVRAALADPAMAGGNEAACITATGGWMEDPGKAQWLAGVAGSPIRVPVGGAWPAVGAARLAAMTLQLFPSDAFGVEFRQVVPS